jgi:Rieske Fe-S protein
MNPNDEGDEKLLHSSRRTFCTGLMFTSTGLVLVGPTVAKALPAQDSMVAYPPRKIDGAELLLPGSGLYFNYPGRNDPAVLVRTSEGEYRAYSRRCSHAGCSVEFDAPSRRLKCPCHQGAYDVRVGQVVFGPPRRPLDEVVLQVRAGAQIWAVGKSFARSPDIIA